MKTIICGAASLIFCGLLNGQAHKANNSTSILTYHDGTVIIQDSSVAIDLSKSVLALYNPGRLRIPPTTTTFISHTHALTQQSAQGDATYTGPSLNPSGTNTTIDNQPHILRVFAGSTHKPPTTYNLHDCDPINVVIQPTSGRSTAPSTISIKMSYADIAIFGSQHESPNPPLPTNPAEYSRTQGWYITFPNALGMTPFSGPGVYKTQALYRLKQIVVQDLTVNLGDGCSALMITTVAQGASAPFPPKLPACSSVIVGGGTTVGKE